MREIGIIGFGSFGKAICNVLLLNDNNICNIFSRNTYCDKHNCKFFQYNNFDDIDFSEISKCEYVFLTTNGITTVDFFQSLIQKKSYLESININIYNAKFIICSKGLIDYDKYNTLFISEYIEKFIPNLSVSFLAGAGFADGITDNIRTIETIATEDYNVYRDCCDIFGKSSLEFEYTERIKSIVLLGAIKNIIAIVVGFYTEKKLHINEIIAIFLDILSDFTKICNFLNIKSNESILCSAGIGDIILTCISDKSRNRLFGKKLARNSKEALIFNQNNVIEGVINLKILYNFCKKEQIDCKSLIKLYNLIEI